MPNSRVANACTIVVEGLKKNTSSITSELSLETFTANVMLTGSDAVSSLWTQLRTQGYEPPDSIENGEATYTIHSIKEIMLPYDKVKVVDTDAVSPDQINIHETFIAHANLWYGKAVEFDIGEKASGEAKHPVQVITDLQGLQVSLQRTPRMPDDNKLHQLPGSLGSYDLFNVEAYADRLPEKIREAGGVFLPMWQREAMWINFEENAGCWANRYAVRVFVGRVNAISGLPMDEGLTLGEENSPEQDYMVIPGQMWLDGICVAPGIVRQFVAMPLGSGYTVEGQTTSEEKYGGMQIEVIPELQKKLRSWRPDTDDLSTSRAFRSQLWKGHGFDETTTPEMHGLHPGDIVRCCPYEVTATVPSRIIDLKATESATQWKAKYSRFKGWYCRSAGSIVVNASNSGSSKDVLPTPPMEPSGFDLEKDIYSAPNLDDLRLRVDTYLPAGHDESLNGVEGEDRQIKMPDIETKDLKAMGLAAGGKLVQDIYKDPYPAAIWNHEAARIIHVHILDPASCEKVTHIVPKPPPMDAQAYVNAGGQFFVVEEQVDNRVEGGDFDNVKSVSQMDKQIGVTTGEDFDPMKPKMCTTCEIRLCDCVIRPCSHQFCNVCIRSLEASGSSESTDSVLSRGKRECPTCNKSVSHVAGFSAPMNLPGEEPMKTKVPVHVLEIKDGRTKFKSIQRTRI